jgi:hypothetical protein
MIKNIVFRLAFAFFIVVEFVFFALLLWVLAEVFPDPSDFLIGILLVLTVAGPFLIGAVSYLVFQRMTHLEYVRSESERWLAQRHIADARRFKRMKKLWRVAIWSPSVAVLLFCLFLDRTWPPLSHLLHPGYGRLGAYRISLPLDWTIVFSEPDLEASHVRSYVVANRWRGVLRSAIDEFVSGKPSMTSSSLDCYRSPSDELDTYSPAGELDRPVTSRNISLRDVALTCKEFAFRNQGGAAKELHTISCVTAEHDFYCTFYDGNRNESSEFYDMVQQITKTK